MITLLIFLVNLALGIFILIKGYKKKLNISFAIFLFITAFWILTNFLFVIIPSLFLMKAQYAFGTLVLFSSLTWIYLITDKMISFKIFLRIILSSFFVFSLAFIDGLVIKEVIINQDSYNLIVGPLFNFYSIALILVYSFIIYKLIKGLLYSKGLQKSQIKYILIGGILFGGSAMMFDFILPFFNIIPVASYDAQSSLFFIGFSAYAITRYRFMDIRIFIRKLMVVSFTICLIIIISLVAREMLKQLFNNYFVEIFILIIALLCYLPLRNYFYNLSNKYLFASLYNKCLIVKEIKDELSEVRTYNEIGEVIYLNLKKIFHINSIAILIIDKKSKIPSVMYNQGFIIDDQELLKEARLDKIFNDISKCKTIIAEEYINKYYLNLDAESTVDLLQEIKAATITSLVENKKIVGFLFVGPKVSEGIFYQDDIFVFDKVCESLSFSLSNIKRSEEKEREINEMREFIKKIK